MAAGALDEFPGQLWAFWSPGQKKSAVHAIHSGCVQGAGATPLQNDSPSVQLVHAMSALTEQGEEMYSVVCGQVVEQSWIFSPSHQRPASTGHGVQDVSATALQGAVA
eukprot:2556073-Rhodomonas_salina.2